MFTYIICIVCLQENIPFTKISDNEFDICINKGISSQLFENITEINFFSRQQKKYIQKINDLLKSSRDEMSSDDDETNFIDCNYYDVNEFNKANFIPDKNFSIFHMNIHSLQLHFDELKLMLQLLNFKFDIIALQALI